MDVRLPDGRILKNVPEGTTKAQIEAKIGKITAAPSPAAEKPAMVDKAKQQYLYELEAKYGLPRGLLDSVWEQESSRGKNLYNESSGAEGDFQFIPKTAKAYNVNVKDFKSSAEGAARMYADLNKQYKGDLPSMLAGYNWGSGKMAKYGMERMPKQTREYIEKVTARMPKRESTAWERMKHNVGLTARAIGQGAASLVDLPGNIHNLGTKLPAIISGEEMPEDNYGIFPHVREGVSEELTRLGVPTPQGGMEQFATNLQEGAALGAPWKGAGMAYGAGSVAASEGAKQAGASPLGQLAAAIAAPAGMAAAAKTAGGLATAGRGYAARGEEALKESQASLRAAGSNMYEEMKRMNAHIKPSAMRGLELAINKEIAPELKAAINSIPVNPAVSVNVGKTAQRLADKKLYQSTDKGFMQELASFRQQMASGQPVSLEMLDKIRRGFANEGSHYSLKAVATIDRFMNQLGGKAMTNNSPEAIKTLNLARQEWSKSARHDDVVKALLKAGGNEAAIKRNLQRLANDRMIQKSWPADEYKALKNAAYYSTPEQLLKLGGKFGIDLDNLKGVGQWGGAGLSATASYLGTGGVTAAAGLVVTSTLIKSLQKAMGRGKAEELLRLIERKQPIPKDVADGIPLSLRTQIFGTQPSKRHARPNPKDKSKVDPNYQDADSYDISENNLLEKR